MERWKTQTAAAAVDTEQELARALEESLVVCRPRLFRTALLMLGQREEAEDATQKTLLKALLARERFRRESEVYTWLYRILLNVCKDHYKAMARASRRFGPLSDPVVETSPHPAPTSHEELEARERDRSVKRALAGLDPKLREVLVLRHYEEMSYEGIASVLGCPIGTVRSRLSAARERLRECMVKEGFYA